MLPAFRFLSHRVRGLTLVASVPSARFGVAAIARSACDAMLAFPPTMAPPRSHYLSVLPHPCFVPPWICELALLFPVVTVSNGVAEITFPAYRHRTRLPPVMAPPSPLSFY